MSLGITKKRRLYITVSMVSFAKLSSKRQSMTIFPRETSTLTGRCTILRIDVSRKRDMERSGEGLL